MNPKKYLQYLGVILVILAIVGFVFPNLAGDFLSFDPLENWAHLILGIVALVLSPLPLGDLKKWIVFLLGVVAVITGFLGFINAGNPAPNFYGYVNFENPADNILHVLVGLWGLFAAFKN